MKLGEIIHAYRIEHEMSMGDFAKFAGVSKAYIGFLEKGVNPKTGRDFAPSIKTIQSVAHAMHMDFDELFNMLDGEVTLKSATTSNVPDATAPAAPTASINANAPAAASNDVKAPAAVSPFNDAVPTVASNAANTAAPSSASIGTPSASDTVNQAAASASDAALAEGDIAKIFEQYGTDTAEQRAALSAALNSLSLPPEKLELMRQVLQMDPDQAAAFLPLARSIVKTP